MLFAIDFDGVISQYDGYKGKGIFGPPLPGVKKAFDFFRSQGHQILINTTRLELDMVKQFLEDNHIAYDYLNCSPYNQENLLHPGKQCADVYIDDRNLRFVGNWNDDFLQKVIAFQPWWKK